MNSSNGAPWVIVVAASAGGVPALRTLVRTLPAQLEAAVVVLLHRPVSRESLLREILGRAAEMPVVDAASGEKVHRGVIYIARPEQHLTVGHDHRFAYHDGRPVRFVRSSANPLLESASAVYHHHTIGVVLTGTGQDATDGVQSVKAHGGIVIVQDPRTAEFGGMPASAIATGAVDMILPLERIGPTLISIVGVADGRNHRHLAPT
jgi:two-component system chemotaxis response regulator CheB